MVDFDRTQLSFVQQKARELVQEERIGTVSRVYEHDEVDDTSNFEVDVQIEGDTKEERAVPVVSSSGSAINVPRTGDRVIVGYLGGESKRPIITGVVYTVDDRPPVGKSGMNRQQYDSAESPAGDGNLYFTGYTKYDEDPALNDKDDINPTESLVRIAKREDSEPDPFEESSVPAQIEFYDAPEKDEAHITVELTKRDSADSDATWGVKFDMKTGEVKIVDPSGYGIVSDGDGNFEWQYKTIKYDEKPDGGDLSL